MTTKPKRYVGGFEERFPRPITHELIMQLYPLLEALPRPLAEHPDWRRKHGAQGITWINSELGKRNVADESARESNRAWVHKHVLPVLGVHSSKIMVSLEFDSDHPEADDNGCVIRLYKMRQATDEELALGAS